MFLGTNRGQRGSGWEFVVESPRHKIMAVPCGEKLCIINATIKGHHGPGKQTEQYSSCGKERGNYYRTCSRGPVSVLVSHSGHIPRSSDLCYLKWCALRCIWRHVDCWWGCEHPVEVCHSWKNFLTKRNSVSWLNRHWSNFAIEKLVLLDIWCRIVHVGPGTLRGDY